MPEQLLAFVLVVYPAAGSFLVVLPHGQGTLIVLQQKQPVDVNGVTPEGLFSPENCRNPSRKPISTERQMFHCFTANGDVEEI